MQLRLLDRLAGTTAAADAFAGALARWQEAQAQVGAGHACKVPAVVPTPAQAF